MTQNEKLLSNQSYTNKDFATIYPELLELAQKISYKWNPVESDESDPGVVLLKLAALMADKNNYNIDKNVLETFPLSVTQLQNARQLFEQCGYSMRYYRSGTTTLTMTLVNEPSISLSQLSELNGGVSVPEDAITNPTYARSYIIPQFTMVSDLENSVVYTTTKECVVSSTGEPKTVPAIQGIINQYTINDVSNITYADLDYNNRLYFTELDIPENGIFITSSYQNNVYDWVKVDNLLLQSTGSYCYKFGITENGSRCYVEFPEDIGTLIGEGLNIHYIRTAGAMGNVGKKRLTQLYTDLKVSRYLTDRSFKSAPLALTTYQNSSGNIYITNDTPVTNGKDPESIDDAYRNYQRVKTTFETLVSRKDYEDFLYSNENISNGYVCDRTNDIQSSYTILDDRETLITSTVAVVNKETEVQVTGKDADGNTVTITSKNQEPEMSAFDLRVYGLTFVDDPTTTDGFNRCFNLIIPDAHNDSSWNEILYDTDGIKSIQHNYKSFETDRILMLMNCFPLVSKIIPNSKLETKQQNEILMAVTKALYGKLNSRVIEFGQAIPYEDVYDTILSADPRIKAITLNDIEYQTFALYISSTDETVKISRIRIDDNSSKPTDDEHKAELWEKFRSEIYAKSVLAGKTPLFVSSSPFAYSLLHSSDTGDGAVCGVIDNVERISTSCTVPFLPLNDGKSFKLDPNNTSYKLRDNENLIFTRPNLINDGSSYGSYVKFLHNIGGGNRKDYGSEDITTVIGKDDVYVLGENEYIIFFWKKENDDNTPYTYIKYGAGDIISPSFTMKEQRNPDPKILPVPIPDNYFMSLPNRVTSTLSDNTFSYTIVDETYSYSYNEYVAKLSGSEWVLTGTNSVQPKKIHSVQVSGGELGRVKMCWALNSSDNKLFSKVTDVEEQKYTLENGEYFFYSNSTGSQINICGSGTIITRKKEHSSATLDDWTCKEFNYSEYVSDGVDYLNDMWVTYDSNISVKVTETEFVQLGKGCSVTLEYIANENRPATFSLSSDSEGTSLHDYKIKYKEDSNASEVTLSSSINADCAWRGRAILNVALKAGVPTDVLPGQVITLHYRENIENSALSTHTIQRPEGDLTYSLSMQSSLAINQTGGTNVDITSVDPQTLEVLYPSVYIYEQRFNPVGIANNSESITRTNKDIKVTFSDENTPEYDVAFVWDGSTANFPTGNYIAKLTLSDDFVLFKLDDSMSEADKSAIEILQTTDFLKGETNAAKAGIYFIKLTVDSTTPALKFNIKPKKVDSSFTLSNFRQYEENVNETAILAKINTLDPEHIFDLLYDVPEDVLIENPLLADSFLDSEHVMNPFTICRWFSEVDAENLPLTKLNKITVTNKIK